MTTRESTHLDELRVSQPLHARARDQRLPLDAPNREQQRQHVAGGLDAQPVRQEGERAPVFGLVGGMVERGGPCCRSKKMPPPSRKCSGSGSSATRAAAPSTSTHQFPLIEL